MSKQALELALEALEGFIPYLPLKDEAQCNRYDKAITAIKEALAQPEQEPVAMRMPKVGDKVICIEDDSLGEIAYLTAGGSPEIKFDDGSHGTYMLREFAELFRYATTSPQRTWVGLTDEEILEAWHWGGAGIEGAHFKVLYNYFEQKLREKNEN